MGYSSEEEVYEESGMTSDTIHEITSKTTAEVTTLVLKYIASGDKKIQRLLKVPITIRKEEHEFFKNKTVKLGPYEDSFEFYGQWNPEDCVEDILAVFTSWGGSAGYYPNGRRVLPFPADCDERTEAITDMTANLNCTLTKETTIKKAGDASIKAVFSAASSFYFPKDANLDTRIYMWDFISFFFRTDNKTATFTVTLYDINGNTETKTFTSNFNNTWEIISLDLDDFVGSIDWAETNLQKIQISANKACTIYFDNFNFNDGVFWTVPEGLICWSDPNSDPIGCISVTYSYDPYKVLTPEDLKEASAKMAAIKLLDYCLGARQRYIAFKQMAEDMDKTPDKESLEVTRGRLKREVMEILAGIGFGTNESIGAP
jgi:hypothetical protein